MVFIANRFRRIDHSVQLKLEDDPFRVYEPGDSIKGYVFLNFSCPLSIIKSIEINVIGFEKSKLFNWIEKIFYKHPIQVPSLNGRNFKVRRSRKTRIYGFNFYLPSALPSSIKTSFGSVSYSLILNLKLKHRNRRVISLPFDVVNLQSPVCTLIHKLEKRKITLYHRKNMFGSIKTMELFFHDSIFILKDILEARVKILCSQKESKFVDYIRRLTLKIKLRVQSHKTAIGSQVLWKDRKSFYSQSRDLDVTSFDVRMDISRGKLDNLWRSSLIQFMLEVTFIVVTDSNKIFSRSVSGPLFENPRLIIN